MKKQASEMKLRTPIIGINNLNPDYWTWGRNCKVIGMTNQEAEDTLDTFLVSDSANRDLFFTGFSQPVQVSDDPGITRIQAEVLRAALKRRGVWFVNMQGMATKFFHRSGYQHGATAFWTS